MSPLSHAPFWYGKNFPIDDIVSPRSEGESPPGVDLVSLRKSPWGKVEVIYSFFECKLSVENIDLLQIVRENLEFFVLPHIQELEKMVMKRRVQWSLTDNRHLLIVIIANILIVVDHWLCDGQQWLITLIKLRFLPAVPYRSRLASARAKNEKRKTFFDDPSVDQSRSGSTIKSLATAKTNTQHNYIYPSIK